MTPHPAWHAGEEMLQRYVDGSADLTLAASLEAHLLACAACRAALAPAVEPRRLTLVRQGLDDRLDQLERPLLERALRRLGLREADARVLCAAPTMRRSWWLAVVLALAVAVAAAASDPGRTDVLLVLAPLLPVLATAVSYAPRLDPALAVTGATPYPAMRLLMLRSGAVAGTSTLLAVLASAALPVGPGEALIWLLPAVALTSAVLALSSWIEAELAAAVCCAGWLTAVWTAFHSDRDALAVYGPPGQLASASLLAAAVVVLVRHRHRLDPGSPA